MSIPEKKWLNVIPIATDWEFYHTKDYILAKGEIFKDWSDILVVQLPISLLVHFVTNFKRKILGLFRGKYKTFKIHDNITVFTPVMLFHYLLWNKFKITFQIDKFFYLKQLNKFINQCYPGKKIIQWVYHPDLNILVGELKYDFLVYDYQDNFNYNFEGKYLPEIAKINHDLISKSNLVLCTAKIMYEDSKIFNNNSYYLPNGNNYQLISSFKENESNPRRNLNFDKPIIGYVGGLRNWLNFELIEYLLKNMDYCNFVFIGLIYKNFRNQVKYLEKYRNFFHLDYVPLCDLSGYLKSFKMGIIPFRINNFSVGIFPNKFFEYMAAGIPIVTTPLVELEKFKDIIWYSESDEQFLENCKNILRNDTSNKLKYYSSLAEKNSWTNKAKKVNNILNSLIEE